MKMNRADRRIRRYLFIGINSLFPKRGKGVFIIAAKIQKLPKQDFVLGVFVEN